MCDRTYGFTKLKYNYQQYYFGFMLIVVKKQEQHIYWRKMIKTHNLYKNTVALFKYFAKKIQKSNLIVDKKETQGT